MIVNSSKTDFAILSDNDIATVLNQFSDTTVLEILHNILNSDIINQSLVLGGGFVLGNMVKSYETNYRIAIEDYPQCAKELQDNRQDVINAIINTICEHYNLSISDTNSYTYELAVFMYEMFISNFALNIIAFFSIYILREQDNLYKMFEIAEMKKKDGSNSYSKQIYGSNSSKLAAIHANLDFVLDNMLGMDITLENFINVIYSDQPLIANMLNNSVNDNGNFYKDYVAKFINRYKTETITNIRLNIQSSATAGMINNYIV